LELAEARNWKFALMAVNRIDVDEEVRRSPAFVSPTEAGRPSQDLQPTLAAVDHHLAREFAEFLEVLGLGKFTWAGLGNPFIDDAAARALLDLYDSLRTTFKEPGVQCRKSANSLIYQIRTPFSPVHLVNVGPLQSVAQDNPTLRGPVMGVWVWIRRRGASQHRVLSMKASDIRQGPLLIVAKNHEDTTGLPYDRAVHNERSYYVPLDHILQASLKESEQRLVQFVQTAVAHLREEISGTVPNKRLQPTARGGGRRRRG
jgi:hypothetical protein